MSPYRSLESRLEDHKKVNPKTGCWLWTGAMSTGGYGRIMLTRPERRLCNVHRISYEIFVGNIPEGLDIDHLCRNRACFNPKHLEPVTRSENCSRGDSGKARGEQQRSRKKCSKGHLFSPENTFVRKRSTGKSYRVCRKCKQNSWKKWRGRNSNKYNKIRQKRYHAS